MGDRRGRRTLEAPGPWRKLGSLHRYAAQHSPFYQEKLSRSARSLSPDPRGWWEAVPVTRLEELITEKEKRGDPYSARLSRARDPLVTVQMEYPADTRLYVGLDRSDLRHYAESLSRAWALLGVGRGDTVAIFDYGTSPLSYLASGLFTPYLDKGAADLSGCVPICNDGVANMSARALEIVRFVRPRCLVVRADLLSPLGVELRRRGVRLAEHVGAVAVGENEGVLAETVRGEFRRQWEVPVHRLARVDLALFLAVECAGCGLFHTWPDRYHVEVLDEHLGTPLAPGQRGVIAITNLFARVCPSIRFLSQLRGAAVEDRCPHGPDDLRLVL